MQLLPSKQYFSSHKERDFQYQLNKNSQRLTIIALYMVTLFLLSLTAVSLVSEDIMENFMINSLRTIMALLAIVLIFVCKRQDFTHIHQHFFAYAILFCLLSGYLFWSFAQTHQELKEGGPMLVVASLVAIPMLHLGHKFILWSILGSSLIAIQVFTPVSIEWTLYFYLTMVIAMGSIQYQLDILLRQQYRAKLIEAEKAKTDQLTGIYNRHSFDKKCKNLIAQLQPSQYIALAMIDIDHFKKYNDNYGHLEGDSALINVAKLLSNCDADIVVRFGGEEFILVKTLQADQLNWLEDLPQRFATSAFPHQYSPFKHITVSAGLAIAKYSDTPVTTKTLLTAADAAMYRVKNAGRNQIMRESI
ncbi:MAG: GGDEF domain-containing protein [Cognaticolwellia sp.]